MKICFLTFVLAACVFFPAAAQGTFTGTWKAGDVGFAPWTFVLNEEGGKVTGWISQSGTDPKISRPDLHTRGDGKSGGPGGLRAQRDAGDD